MNNSKIMSLFKTTLFALGCALSLTLLTAPSLKADTTAPALKALPLSHTIEKAAHPAENTPPFSLKLKNDSKAALKVSGKILLSVHSHNADKARAVPEHVIEAGQSMTIDGLAALDIVTVSAEGFAPLKVEIK